MSPVGKNLLIAVGFVAFLIGLGLAALWPRGGDDLPQITGFVYPEPKTVSPFALTADDGSTFDRSDLEGRWTFVFFGYTHCPDVCPLTLAELAGVEQRLRQAGVAAETQHVFVSVDPQRDDPARLREYVRHFDPTFVGATGPEPVLRQLTRELGVLFDYPEGKEGANYEVAHSASIELFDPDGRLHAVFTAPHDAQTIAEDFRKIHRHWQQRRSRGA